jgi:lipoate-protein ligase A
MRPAHLYTHYAADPYFNMACDEWLMTAARLRPQIVLLRLYTWRVGAITIGVNQRHATACDWSHTDDTPVIRRVTGGRALFHDRSELTYAIALDTAGDDRSPALRGSVSHTSRSIAMALASFIESVDRPVSYVKFSSPENARPEFFHAAPCFASRARYELVDGVSKVVASAQRRIGNILLQHGSIKLAGVAGHPALPGLDDTAALTPLEPVTADCFARYASLWTTSVGSALGLDVSRTELPVSELDRIQLAATTLSKNALSRRDPIKQIIPRLSL